MPKVLIVDDEEDILWGLSEELSRNGIDVDTASNGQEAFEKIKENDYDFLITDIRMPGMSGSELLLKSKNLRPDLKVVVMTAFGSDELKQEVLSHGAISYLEKPFDFEQLLELIKEKGKKVDETISKLSLNQFMQLVSMEGQSCTITVKTDEGESKLYFIDGEVVNAELQNFSGEEAFLKIMKFNKPAFDVDWGVPQTKRLIEKPLHALLLAAVAKKEEEEAGVSSEKEIEEEEVDFSALTDLFGEDEGVTEGTEEVVEEDIQEEKVEEPTLENVAEEGMELDLEEISFGDEGVVEEESEEEVSEEELEKEMVEEPTVDNVEEVGAVEGKEEVEEPEEEFSLENIEEMLEQEVEEEIPPSEAGEEEVAAQVADQGVEEVAEEELAQENEEEFSLDNLEDMLEEEVNVSQESRVEESLSSEQEKVVEESVEKESEEVKEEVEEEVSMSGETRLEGAEVNEVIEDVEESQVEEGAEGTEQEEGMGKVEAVEEEVAESQDEEIVEEMESPVAEQEEEKVDVEEQLESPVEEVKEEKDTVEEVEKVVEKQPAKAVAEKGAPIIEGDKVGVVEDVLRKIVALTTDVHGGFVADVNGNIVASQFKSGNIKGDDLGYLGEHIGMMFEILKQVSGEEIEDISVSLKSENLIAAPALDGNIAIFVITAKRTMKLALIKVELKKAAARMKEELS